MDPRDDLRSVFWSAFAGATRAVTRARDAMLERHGINTGQLSILARLWADDGLSPGEIARALDQPTAMVTGAAAEMEAAGLIQRQGGHPVTLRLTVRGREMEKIIDRDMRTLGEHVLSSFDDAERGQLIAFLRAVRTNASGG